MVRETKHLGRVMWPGNGNIIFSEEKHSSFMENGKYKDKINAAAYQIHPDGSGLEELWRWNERSEYQDILWLTPDSEYLVVAKNTDIGRTYGIYDRGESKIKKELRYQGKFSGSYEDNKIAIDDFNHLMIINLDTLTTKIFDSKGKNTFEKLLTGFEYGALSPDRSMYTREGGVWTVGNKKVVADFSVKPKRSYLFNIFWK